ncbi:MAG: 3-carboxy-cis,cis-muconate cycloisomerase [Pseudomonadota bacterium]
MSQVFNNPWLRGLFGDAEADQIWSPETQLEHYLKFEIALAYALESVGNVPIGHGAAAAEAIQSETIDMERLHLGTERDGLPIPDLVRQLRSFAGNHADAVHTGATSQDVLDTALALSMRALVALILQRCNSLDSSLSDLILKHGSSQMMGRTRMQAALPISAGDRIKTWRAPLHGHIAQFIAVQPRVSQLQLGGATGTRSQYGDKADQIAEEMARQLDLNTAPHVWHTDRSAIALLCSNLSNLSGTLGKMGQDIALMAQQGIDEIKLSSGGGSSAMPHKSNPILAELLVTLARFNATQLSGMQHAVIHEQERSGAAWMLEWMILPSMARATCRSLSAAQSLCDQIQSIGGGPN